MRIPSYTANRTRSSIPTRPVVTPPPGGVAKPTKTKAQELAEKRQKALKKCKKLKGKAKAQCVKKANQIGKPKPKKHKK